VSPANDPSVRAALRATIAFTFGIRAIGLVRGLLLARLVGPGAFGLFAGIVAFTSVAGLIAELGLTPYVVFRGPRARDDAATVATFSLISGLIGAAAVALLATPIAEFYSWPDARWIVLALSGSVLIGTLTAAPMGILRSELRFADIGKSQGLGEIAALPTALMVAVVGGGIWALVTAFLVAQAVALVMLWKRSGLGLPSLGANWLEPARTALSYGGPVVGGAIVWSVALQGDNVVVGHNLGTWMLGLYAFAFSYGSLPGGTVGALVGPVAFPTLVRIRHDLAGFYRQFAVFIRLSALIVLPGAAAGVALAPLAIEVILGHQWSGAAQPLQLFLAVGALRALFPTDQVMRALGQTKWELILGLVAAPATVVAALVGSRVNILLVAVLVSLVAIVSSVWSVWIGARLMRVGILHLLREPLPACVVGLACGLAAWLATLIPAPSPLRLAAGLLAAATIYLILIRSDRVPGAAHLKDLVRSRTLLAEPI
jgi:PST family polysaccharide transporter